MAIRRERVIFEATDRFTGPVVRMAGASTLLKNRLADLNRTQVITHKSAGDLAGAQGIPGIDRAASTASWKIDRFSGRLRILAGLAASIGPAFVPITATAIPAVTGLASGLGFVTLATGGTVFALSGLGSALDALNKYRLEPTEANLEAARKQMQLISPEARAMVRELAALAPVLRELRSTGQAGFLPGFDRGVDHLLRLLPRALAIIDEITDTSGDLFADGAASLASDRWEDFFEFLETDARPTLVETARLTGNVAHGLAELWMAFQPTNMRGLEILADGADRFDKWATGLDETQGFENFVQFINDNGPQVAETLGAVGMAIVDIVQATAPLGGPSLRIIEATAEALSLIADSPIGPVLLAGAAGMSALNLAAWAFSRPLNSARAGIAQLVADLRTMRTTGAAAWQTNTAGALQYAAASGRVKGQLAGIGKTAAGVGALAFATSGLADEMGVANTAMLGTAGAMAGPWGAAIGAGIGLMLDWQASQQRAKEKAEELTTTLNQQTGAITQSTRAWLVDELAKDGWLEKANEIGVSGELVVDTILQGSDAVEKQRLALVAATDGNAVYGQQIQQLSGEMSHWAGVVEDGREVTLLKARAMGEDTQATEEYAGATNRATTATARFAAEQRRLHGILDRRATWREWQAAIDDARAALKKNGRTLDENTEKGRENATALDTMIRNAAEWAAELKRSDRQRFASQARRDILAAARDMGATKRQIDEIRAALRLLDGTTANTYINQTVRKLGAQDLGFRVGGYTGRLHPDRIAGVVHGDEHVIRSESRRRIERRHPGALDYMNRYGRIPGYRHGGHVDPRYARAFSPTTGTHTTTRVVVVAQSGPAELTVRGVLDTPFGPAHVEGIARAVYRDESSADREFDNMLDEANR